MNLASINLQTCKLISDLCNESVLNKSTLLCKSKFAIIEPLPQMSSESVLGADSSIRANTTTTT